MRYFYLFMLVILSSNVFAQNDCETYLAKGDTLQYKVCKKANETIGHNQFSKEYQTILDEIIELDPTIHYVYWAKSIAYLKSGDFVTWKKLIDKAVNLNPKEYLGYRGWCRYQFFRDFEGAIKDIEKLDSLVDYDIGHSQNGTYHLNIAKGLCYSAIGEKEKAIEMLDKQIKLNENDDFVGPYDYLHLGVLYLETNKFENALETLNKQSESNELAENQYYLSLTYLKLKKLAESKVSLEKAKQLYTTERRMFDPYTNPMDKIYLEQIETELKRIKNSK